MQAGNAELVRFRRAQRHLRLRFISHKEHEGWNSFTIRRPRLDSGEVTKIS